MKKVRVTVTAQERLDDKYNPSSLNRFTYVTTALWDRQGRKYNVTVAPFKTVLRIKIKPSQVPGLLASLHVWRNRLVVDVRMDWGTP